MNRIQGFRYIYTYTLTYLAGVPLVCGRLRVTFYHLCDYYCPRPLEPLVFHFIHFQPLQRYFGPLLVGWSGMALAISESTGSIASVTTGAGREAFGIIWGELLCSSFSIFTIASLYKCWNFFTHKCGRPKLENASSPDGGGFGGGRGGRGVEVLGVEEDVEALVETGVVLVVEGEGV